MPETDALDAVVVGGGLAGLIAALRCARAGLRTVLLEAEAEVGGCVRFHEVAGMRVDRGAEAFATTRPAAGKLIAELGLAIETPAAGAAWLYNRNGAAPIPAATLLGIPADLRAADVRRVIGRAGVLRARMDRLLPRSVAPDGLGRLVRARLGRPVLRRLVAPIAGGVYATDPLGLDIDAVAPGLVAALQRTGSLTAAVAELRRDRKAAGSAVATVSGGMSNLTRALADAFAAAGGTIRCRSRVTAVTAQGRGWHVEVVDPADSRDELLAERVVVATPPAQARALLAQATNGAVRLPAPPSSQVVIVTLVVDAPRLDEAPRGSGLLVAPDVTSVAAKALTHATAKWAYLAEMAGPHRHVLRLSFGRGRGEWDIGKTMRLEDRALQDAATLLGVPLRQEDVVDAAVVRYSSGLAAPRAALQAELGRATAALSGFPTVTLCGSAVAGTGIGAVVADATTASIVGVSALGAR